MNPIELLAPSPRKLRPSRAKLCLAVGVVITVLTLIFVPNANAALGDSGSGSGGSGAGHWTSNGFGWKKFSKTSGGPGNGFQSGSWSNVLAQCAQYSSSYVWVHVVRNPSGQEKSFNYSGASYNRNRPASGLDPYVYNSSGDYQYQGAAYQSHVINIVASVKAAFMVEHAAYESRWGVSVGWFCDGKKQTYTLTPSVTLNPAAAVETNSELTVNPTIANAGPSRSANVAWQLTRIEVSPGVGVPNSGGGNSSSAPCGTYFRAAGASCEVVRSGSSEIATSGLRISEYSERVGDLEVGSKICYSLSVQPYSHASSQWRHSAPRCVAIGAKPKVQIWGGDLIVGRAFNGMELPESNSVVETSLTVKVGETPRASPGDIKARERATKRYWYFGNRASIDFGTSGNNAVAQQGSGSTSAEGTTVVTDFTGRLLFWTNGRTIFNSTGASMQNGTGLNAGASSTQAAVAFSLGPASEGKYAVVTNTAEDESSGAGALYYSVVDMSLAGGRGAVVSGKKNLPLYGSTTGYSGEALTAAPKADGSGYWVLTFRPGNTEVFVFSFNKDGLASSTPQRFTAGTPAINKRSGVNTAFGTLNFSSDYSRLILHAGSHCTGSAGCSSRNGVLRLMHFNAQNGSITNAHTWNSENSRGNAAGYSADFSPSGRYVYVSQIYPSHLYRYDTSLSTNSAIKNSAQYIGSPGGGNYDGGGQVKRAPNGKMYVANNTSSRISVINNPDSTGSVGWSYNGFTLSSGTSSRFGLPQMVTAPSVDDTPVGTQDITYGSWVEYGIFAPNYVNGTASGSGLNGGSVVSRIDWSRLTFANDHTGSRSEPCASGAIKFGCFNTSHSTIPDVMSNFPVTSSTPRISGDVSIGALPSGVSTSNTGGNATINLTGGEVGKGRWHVINAPNATVNIRGDITYTNETLHDTSEIPQLIIIAKDINIAGSVNQVDAWLVAIGGSVVTCSDRGTAQQLRTTSVTGLPNAYRLSINHCDNLLTINGPVMAQSLWLRRTAGSGTGVSSGDPAEIINLRPDAYLWASERSKLTPRPQTVFTIEDAPRL